MAYEVVRITPDQATKTLTTQEGQFSDVKSTLVKPSDLTKTVSAFANTDGGELFVGISESGRDKERTWEGFSDPEAANAHAQVFEHLFPVGTDFSYEFLKCDAWPGLVLHVQINKTQGIVKASNNLPYIRRSAQNLPASSPELMKRLEYSKGVVSFESEPVAVSKETITESNVIQEFIELIVPTSEPEKWLRKQVLIRENRPTVAGLLLFADEPQAALPKHCGIKVYRFKTKDDAGSRDTMAFLPLTIEGHLYDQITKAVQTTTHVVEGVPRMGDSGLEQVLYPPETLHEIITNAVIHRDYSIADDVHIRIFDNRIEIQSPGRLPAHITVRNILDERFARNGSIVRILNKYPDPPNKDIGEGLNTAFAAMHKLGLREPVIVEQENSVLVIVKHEPLASPEEAILDYLQTHVTIKNREAREITHITSDFRIKAIFGRMIEKGMIEQVPGTRTSNTCYQLPQNPAAATSDSRENGKRGRR